MSLDIGPYFRPKQRGSMLLSVLFIILILAALMAGLATLSGQSSQQLVYEVQALKARLAAESVLERQVFASLGDINTTEVVAVGSPITINQCQAHVDELKITSGAVPVQAKIISTGTCTGSGLTVIRNIEVEVIE